jgi:transcriptional regulator of heat shock response
MMDTLTNREASVLEAIVRSYIADPTPVASSHIRTSSSPATIRMVMNALEQKQYLRQPHTSAGRIPTGKGYRFFVDNCIEERPISQIISHRLKHIHEWHSLLRAIAEETHLMTLATYGNPPTIIQFGMGGVLEAPEFDNPQMTRKFGHLIDSFLHNQDMYSAYLPDNSSEPWVFIEEENPLPEAQFTSIVSRSFDDGIILTIGPSRMNYETAITILKSL